MRTPDLMPILSAGAHPDPSKGACLMEMASFLAGEEWSDRPSCTHPVLAVIAQSVNDRMSDTARPALLSRLPRLMNTREGRGRKVPLALMDWCLAHSNTAPDLIPKRDTYASQARQQDRPAGVVANAVNAAYFCLSSGMGVVAYLAFLDGLLDEYDALTGRTAPASLTPDDTTRLVQLTHA